MTMAREDLVKLFHQRFDFFRQRDAAALAATFSEDAIVESPTAGLHKGRAAIEKVYRAWFDAFPDVQVSDEEVLVDQDRVATFQRIVGTHRGPFLGLAPSGRSFEIRVVTLNHMRDGLIVHERRLLDFTGFLVQIGVLKAKPG